LSLLLLTIMLFHFADAPGAPRQWWFGGGTDLTPAYIFEEDVKHFHSVSAHNIGFSNLVVKSQILW